MSLVDGKPLLTAALTAIFSDISPGKTPAATAALIADAIDAFVKSGVVPISTVVVTPDTINGTGTGVSSVV